MLYNVIDFAYQELERYLKRLGITAEIILGVVPTLCEVADSRYDDAIEICVTDQKGYIHGSNERSVLIGVYRLLHEWGIRWIRPGKNGTYYPTSPKACDIKLCEQAAKRHRTMCIEGAVSLENVLDMIDWCPKAGFNGYYIQFDSAFTFFDRWYSHTGSTVKEAEPFCEERALEYVGIMTEALKKRGMMLHRMGHGWTCNPFGVRISSWETVDPDAIPDSYKKICAKVNGKRGLWQNEPLRTQVCLSNPAVRTTIADAVIDYAKNNPATDVIHFWLGDYFNNFCECDDCMGRRVSEFYVMLLNEITEKLEREGLEPLIGFIAYYNTAHPPLIEKLKHPERLILTFAPISRTFGASFPKGFNRKEMPEYEHNQFKNSREIDENLSYLYAWEQYYQGDTIDFDYHLMWSHILDAGAEGIARVIYDDICNFKNLGINGYVSCQLQRNTFPTSIAMTVMGKTLWDDSADFDSMRRELYEACFGKDMVETMCEYFATLSKGFHIGWIRAQIPYNKDVFAQSLQNALAAMKEMEPVAKAHLGEGDPCRQECWKLVWLGAKLYSIIGEAILIRLNGDIEKSEALVSTAAQMAWEHEDELQCALDCMFFDKVTKSRITPEKAIANQDV